MEGQSSAGQPQYLYQSVQWSRLVRRNNLSEQPPLLSPPSLVPSPQFPPIDALPSLLPQTPSQIQLQLAHYNKLLASSGSARTPRQLSAPLPPVVSTQHIQAAPRGSISGSEGNKTSRTHRTGHGRKKSPALGNDERPLITKEGGTGKMSSRKNDSSKQHGSRPLVQHSNSMASQRSESVPTTPHQHSRQFSLGSRDPSPNGPGDHSPRSAYSESNSTLPSLRPMQKRSACKYETAIAGSKRRMPYNIGSDKLEKVKKESIKAKLTADEERKVTGDMRELYDRLIPTPESEAKRVKFVEKLEKLLNEEWPGRDILVHMFGSSGNLLCTDDSDVDICITTEWKALEGVCILADCLARRGMKNVVCISQAKVPIVKMWDPELGLACDMNVNNTMALENTRMIKTYVMIDERVRPLAMIIKHWTKRRIVNDAAFGGTLSSYTWICMIINFLQTRSPIILPSLHQRPHQKLPPREGSESTFADDVNTLRNCGKDNKDTLGDLLFQFFKFFGHEMDYDKLVLSVRNGKLTVKSDKPGWERATNNRLCVEEPFNTARNLGNTADDTSFRGLHLELRRAFDLISEAKLDECCEQYIYPKEEERFFERPPPQPRPILSRSASQTRGGRHYARGPRSNNHNHNRGGHPRRASSGAFDANTSYVPPIVPQGLTPQETWHHSQLAQERLHNDLFATFSQLQAQENNLRLQLYNQSQQYAAQAAQAQAQAFHQSQRLQPNGTIKMQQATDRSRGISFDNPPFTAPIRPEFYYFPLQYQNVPMYGAHSPSTYPSSPSLSPAIPELRRSLHRSSATNGSGGGNGSSNSSLRSHSQPASRSGPSPLALQAAPTSNYSGNNFPGYQPLRHPSNVMIPNFIADDIGEPGYDMDTDSVPASANSPPDGTTKEYLGYFFSSEVPSIPPVPAVIPRRSSIVPPPIPAFGDIQASRRRPSTDQFPSAILGRVRRNSRSPSPSGHDRSQSTSAAIITGTPHAMSSGNAHYPGPAIVNGSNPGMSSYESDGHHSVSEASVSEASTYNDPLASSMESLRIDNLPSLTTDQSPHSFTQSAATGIWHEKIPIPNGTGFAHVEKASGNPAHLTGLGISTAGPFESQNSSNRLSPNRNNPGRSSQNGSVSPLDIGFSKMESTRDDIPHLSPVYEARTPSPTANRKLEPSSENSRSETPTQASKPAAKAALNSSTNKQPKSTSQPKVNGHTRDSKSEGGGSGTWQKISKGKKKGQAQDQKGQASAEPTPVNDSERKGG